MRKEFIKLNGQHSNVTPRCDPYQGHIEICEFGCWQPKISIFVNDISLILTKNIQNELTEEQWNSLKNNVDSVLNKFLNDLMKVADDL